MAKITFNMENNKFMYTTIERLEMSTRTTNALRRAGFSTVGDVIKTQENLDEFKARNFGEFARKEFYHRLVQYYTECLEPDQLAAFLADLISQGVNVKRVAE